MVRDTQTSYCSTLNGVFLVCGVEKCVRCNNRRGSCDECVHGYEVLVPRNDDDDDYRCVTEEEHRGW